MKKFAGKFLQVSLVAIFFASVTPCSVLAEDAESSGLMGHDSAKGIVVARVNGNDINMEQLLKAMREVAQKKYGTQGISPLLAEKIKQEAIERLIVQELAYRKAAQKVEVTQSALQQRIDTLRKQAESDDAFIKKVDEDYGSMQQYMLWLERFMTIEKFVEQEIDSKIQITEQDIAAAYEQAKSAYFVKQELVQVDDIIFFFDPADAQSIKKIEEIRRKITEDHGGDPSKYKNDGSFVIIKNVALDEKEHSALYAAARELKEYGLSEPINVDGNYHVVQLIGYSPAVNKSIEEVTPYLKEEIKKNKRQSLLNGWMAGLKEGAEIEIVDITL